MRDDLASPNLGSAPRDYNSTFFNRAMKSIELTIARFLAKGPVQITDLTVDTVTATDVTVSDDLVVTDDATVGGDLAVTGTSNFVGATTASTIAATTVTADDVTVNDDLVVTDDASVGGDFSVTGTSTLGDVNASDGFFSSLNGPIGTVTPTTGNFTILAANETYSDIFVSTGDATIGGNLEVAGTSELNGVVTINGGSGVNVQPLEIISTNADASFGPDLSLYRNSSTPNAVDVLGFYSFFGNNSAAEKIRYAGVAGGVNTTTDGAEEGRLYLQTCVAGNGTNVVIIDGEVVDLTRGQLKFPATQNASSDANTMDDYEEGDWTPVVIGATTAGTGTYSSQTGTYTKVGNLVFITALVGITAHTGTGGMRISGLPFAGAVTNHTLAVWSSGMTAAPQTLTSGSLILFYAALNSATVMDLAADTNWSLRVSGCYVTS